MSKEFFLKTRECLTRANYTSPKIKDLCIRCKLIGDELCEDNVFEFFFWTVWWSRKILYYRDDLESRLSDAESHISELEFDVSSLEDDIEHLKSENESLAGLDESF